MSTFPPDFVQKVVSKYGGIRVGSEFKCCCPAHDDKNPSLYIRDGNTAPIFRCMSAGCSYESLMAAFRRDGLVNGVPDSYSWQSHLPPGVPPSWPPRSVLEKAGQSPNGENQKLYRCHYAYRDAGGEIIGFVVRYERDGKKDTIPFFKRDPSGRWWRSGYSSSENRSLYGLEQLDIGDAEVGSVWILEGEKCVDAFTEFEKKTNIGGNRVAVSWPGGAGAVKKADFRPLAGKHVVIFPDFDGPGLRAARWIADTLLAMRCRVFYVDIGAMWEGQNPEGQDFVNWVEGGGKDISLISYSREDIWPKNLGKAEKPKEVPAPVQQFEEYEAPTDLRLNEFGLTERVLKRHGDKIRIITGRGPHIYETDHWVRDTSGKTKALILDTVERIPEEVKTMKPKRAEVVLKFAERCKKNAILNNVSALLECNQSIRLESDDLDPDQYALNCKNLTVDLRSGITRKHNPKDHHSKVTAAIYDENAKCPTWEEFLRFTFRDDAPLLNYFQKAVGYCATGDCSEQVFFITRGNGGNGKSVAFETILHVLGSYAGPLASNVLLLNSYGDPASDPFAVASLIGTRFCLSSEIPQRARLNEARMKELTGQDSVQARHLYQDFFTFKPIAKFWLRCNEYPIMGSGDSGTWRRIRCIPFDRTLKEVSEVFDPRLKDRLEAEAPGILAWIVQGAIRWFNERLGEPTPRMLREKVLVQSELDPLGPWLVDNISFIDESRTHLTELYRNYKEWCKDLGEKERSANWLSREMVNRGFKAGRSEFGRFFEGITLKHGGMRPVVDDFNL